MSSASNKILQAAAGNAAGEALYVEEVFSTYLWPGSSKSTAGGHLAENGIALSDENVGGSVRFFGQSGSRVRANGNSAYDLSGDDWTVEYFYYPITSSTEVHVDNSVNGSYTTTMEFEVYSGGGVIYYVCNGTIPITSPSGTITKGEWHHIALSTVSGTTTMYVNGVSVGTTTTLPDANTYHWEIGDRVTSAVSGNYPVEGCISNFRMVVGTGVYTGAFTPPTEDLTAVTNTQLLCLQGDDPFTDNSGNSRTITKSDSGLKSTTFGPFTSDTEGKGGLVWIKDRENSSGSHFLCDTERGATKFLQSNTTNAEQTVSNSLTGFNANGFTTSDWSNPDRDQVSWTFAKHEKFFDVVTYTGTGSVQNISHNLGSVPGCIITKKLSSTSNWAVYHRGITSGENGAIVLNSTNAFVSSSAVWNNTAPTDSVFTVGTADATNVSGQTYVAYLFAHNDDDGIFGENGDQDIIKCGSVTGTAEVDLGFEPQWVLLKKSDGSGSNWRIMDNMRGMAVGGNDGPIFPDSTAAELTSSDMINITSTGFSQTLSGTWIYIAIRRGPMKTPESGTEVFDIGYEENGPYSVGFPVDSALFKWRDGTQSWYWKDRIRGDNASLNTDATNAEANVGNTDWDLQDEIDDSTFFVGDFYMQYLFRRAPGFSDVVCYEGTGVAQAINHNLGVVPEMIIVKNRDDTGSWLVYHEGVSDDPETDYLVLNASNAVADINTAWNDTAPTATNFTVGTSHSANGSSDSCIAYLFATLDGVSKVGSYSGNASGTGTQTIDCGFSNGARFVLIKCTSGTGNWVLFDTERGITSGLDNFLLLNATDAQTTNADLDVDPDGTGFILDGDHTSINRLGRDYIFLAIA